MVDGARVAMILSSATARCPMRDTTQAYNEIMTEALRQYEDYVDLANLSDVASVLEAEAAAYQNPEPLPPLTFKD